MARRDLAKVNLLLLLEYSLTMSFGHMVIWLSWFLEVIKSTGISNAISIRVVMENRTMFKYVYNSP